MTSLKIPKGTFDVLPYGEREAWQQVSLWQWVEKIARETAEDFSFLEIRTPIYEKIELFDRGVGETSDIVTKEMFGFEDKAGRKMCLRPEGTSSVMRSFLENHLLQERQVHKFFYIGPMFRYERPQSGRYRQHHQFGVEYIGESSPESDAETILFLHEFYMRIGLKNIRVELNSVGDLQSRKAYKTALLKYLTPHFHSLSTDSQERFEKNPLRILDSKDPEDKEIVEKAPSILDHLSESSRKHFERVCDLLKSFNIPFVVNDKIVRGLDYYQKTVFEFLIDGSKTIGAGGRYDGLSSLFNGPDLPAVGFATGLERVIQLLLEQQESFQAPKKSLLYIVPMIEEAKKIAMDLASISRKTHTSTHIDWSFKKMQNSIQKAEKMGASSMIILGEDEVKKRSFQLKDLKKREQKEHPMAAFENCLLGMEK